MHAGVGHWIGSVDSADPPGVLECARQKRFDPLERVVPERTAVLGFCLASNVAKQRLAVAASELPQRDFTETRLDMDAEDVSVVFVGARALFALHSRKKNSFDKVRDLHRAAHVLRVCVDGQKDFVRQRSHGFFRAVGIADWSEFLAELRADAPAVAQHRIAVTEKPELALPEDVTALLLRHLRPPFLSQSFFLPYSETERPAALASDFKRANSSRVRRRLRIALRRSAFGSRGLPLRTAGPYL